MIKPKPFKLICQKCKYSKIIRPQSDSLNIMDVIDVCPKCAVPMKQSKISNTDNILANIFSKLFRR